MCCFLFAQTRKIAGAIKEIAILSFFSKRPTPLTLVLVTTFTASGCSFNEHGSSISQITKADGAFVYELQARGIHFASSPRGASVSIGEFREVLVFSSECFAGDIAPLTRKSLLDTAIPALSVLDVKGAALAVGLRDTGVTVGRRQQMLLLSGNAERSAYRELFYDTEKLELTRLRAKGWKLCLQGASG